MKHLFYNPPRRVMLNFTLALGYWSLSMLIPSTNLLPEAVSSAFADFNSTAATQVSIGVDSNGGQVAPEGETLEPVAPSNAGFMVFASSAKNLTSDYAQDDNSFPTNIYRYSETQEIQLLSKNKDRDIITSGARSISPAVSEVLPDGSYAVAFVSNATDLIENYNSSNQFFSPDQIYVYLSSLDKNILISHRADSPSTGSIHTSANPTIALLSAKPLKYRVCFESYSNDLVDGGSDDASQYTSVYCRALVVKGAQTNTTEAQSIVSKPSRDISRPFLSQDGLKLVFSSQGEVIPELTTNNFSQVYQYVFRTNSFQLVSKNQSGQPALGDSTRPSTTHKGGLVSFLYDPTGINGGSADLASLEGVTSPIIALADLVKDTRVQVNSSSQGTASDGNAIAGKVDSGGRFIIFSDTGTNLLDTAINLSAKSQVYVRDMKTNSIALVSKNTLAEPGDDDSGSNGDSVNSSRQLPITLVGTGQYESSFMTGFVSGADNLASIGDPDIYSALYLFNSTVSIPKRPLTNRATIEAPANVEVLRNRPNGKKDIRISCEEFEIDLSQFGVQSNELSATAEGRLRYRIELRKRGSRQKIVRNRRRNSSTFRRLDPGRYVVRYRVIARRGSETVRSRYSPRTTLDIS